MSTAATLPKIADELEGRAERAGRIEPHARLTALGLCI